MKKEREEPNKDFVNRQWLQLADVAENDVAEVGLEVEEGIRQPVREAMDVDASHPRDTGALGAGARPKVRPIYMAAFLRKWVSKRVFAVNATDIDLVMYTMRYWERGRLEGQKR